MALPGWYTENNKLVIVNDAIMVIFAFIFLSPDYMSPVILHRIEMEFSSF